MSADRIWSVLVNNCTKRTGSVNTERCTHPGNKGNACRPKLCPLVPKLAEASAPAPPLYPQLDHRSADEIR